MACIILREVIVITISELMLNVKNVRLEQLVFQSDIKTQEQIKELNERGYRVNFTDAEFREKFKVPTDCVAYTPSISYSCMYFNRDSLAVLQFPDGFDEVIALSSAADINSCLVTN
mgnify:CR=1 FL=1